MTRPSNERGVSEPLTSEEIGELERLLEKATPGPWAIESCGEKGDGSDMIGVVFDPETDPDCKTPLSGWLPACREDGEFIEYYVDEAVAELEHRNRNSGADASLIVAMRNALPRLLSSLKGSAAQGNTSAAGAGSFDALDTPPTALEIAHTVLRDIGQRVEDVRAKIGVGAELDSALSFITTQCLNVLSPNDKTEAKDG